MGKITLGNGLVVGVPDVIPGVPDIPPLEGMLPEVDGPAEEVVVELLEFMPVRGCDAEDVAGDPQLDGTEPGVAFAAAEYPGCWLPLPDDEAEV